MKSYDSTLPIPCVEILVHFPIPLLAISNHLVPFVPQSLRDRLLFVVVGQCWQCQRVANPEESERVESGNREGNERRNVEKKALRGCVERGGVDKVC